MRLSALIHLVQSVRAVAQCDRIYVLGSSSLLVSFPELAEPLLTATYDADLLVEPCDEELAAVVHEAVGEGSLFAKRTGYHADLLRPNIVESLPKDWRERLVPLEGVPNADALAPLDLLVVKLCAGRVKDLELVRSVMRAAAIPASKLRARLDATMLDEREVVKVYARLEEIIGD
jgi:hypothetical protein